MSYSKLIATLLYLIFTIWLFLETNMSYLGQLSVALFILSLGLFIFSKMPAGLSAMLVVCLGVLLGLPESILYESLEEHVIWLMIGAFIIGGVVETSGLLDRLIRWIEVKCTSEKRLNVFVFLFIQILSLIIPSTSGRAAALLPVYQAFTNRFSANRRYLGLLMPILVLMGTNLSLIGAGSHLIGIGLLENQADESITYLQFLIWGLPFGIVIGIISLLMIKKIYMQPIEAEVTEKIIEPVHEKHPFSTKEKKALVLIGLTVLLWITEPVHQFDIAFITILMSLIMMLPKIDLIGWREAFNRVSWSLIFFVAGATALGNLLAKYKVLDVIQHNLFKVMHHLELTNTFVPLVLIVVISVTSHLYITSHTSRAVVFIPLLIVFGKMFGLNLTAVVFMALIGMNYCLTFPVSSKALLLFYENKEKPFTIKQLMHLSMWLMPLYMIAMIVMYYVFWQHVGLALK
ncbi:anion permease [Staphylococcus sp. IVB6181]|uniref:SLC13 family permease n=1 Tax=Staphylococcus sp. IVB6181 TaxID=2929481 RepID=UPI0021CEBD87|nr:SLC13 family permease [Staphylococcus sp. IVB6181]UXV34089.1 anion permease [Staphylococcus sp. IVB6181]